MFRRLCSLEDLGLQLSGMLTGISEGHFGVAPPPPPSFSGAMAAGAAAAGASPPPGGASAPAPAAAAAAAASPSASVQDWQSLSAARSATAFATDSQLALRTAVVYAEDGVRGRPMIAVTAASSRARDIIYNPYYENFYVVLQFVHLIQAQWELPADGATLESELWCQGLDALILLAVIADMLLLQRAYLSPERWLTKAWVVVKALVLTALCLNFVTSILLPGTPYLARFLRPLLLIERKSTVRKICTTIVKAAPRILSAATLILIHVLAFSVMAFILFSGVEGPPACQPLRSPRAALVCSVWVPPAFGGCRAYFGSLEESLVHVFSMITGAEFPGALLPAMQCNPGYSGFFLVAFFSGNFFILRLCFAVVYNDSGAFKKDEIILRFKQTFDNFDAAFAELAKEGLADRAAAAAGVDGAKGGGGGSGSGADAAAPPTLTRERVTTFWRALRPKMDPELVQLMYDSVLPGPVRRALQEAAAEEEEGGVPASPSALPCDDLTRQDFRRLCYLYSSVSARRVVLPEGLSGKGMEALSLADSEAAGDGASGKEFEGLLSTLAATKEAKERERRAEEGRREAQRQAGKGSGGGGGGGGGGSATPNPLAVAAATAAAAAGSEAAAAAVAVPVEPAADAAAAAAAPQLPSALLQRQRSMSGVSSAGGQRARSATFSSSSTGQKLQAHFQGSLSALHNIAQAYFVGNLTTLEDKVALLMNHGVPNGIDPHGWRARGLHVIHSLPVHVFNELCGLANALAVLCILAFEDPGPRSPELREKLTLLGIINYTTFALFGLEIAALVVLTGLRRWLRQSWWNVADVVIFFVALAGTVVDQLTSAGFDNPNELLTFSLFCRLGKVLRVLRLLPGLERSVLAACQIVLPFGRYLTIILCLLWGYALIGTVYFGGILGTNPQLAGTAYSLLGYQALNFDSPLRGMVAMVQQLNIVEWPIMMEAAVAATGSRAPRLFFMSFWFLGVFVVLNITFAFIVTGFSAERARQERRAVLESLVLQELVNKIDAAEAAHGGGHEDGHGHGGGGHGGHGGHGHGHGSSESPEMTAKVLATIGRRFRPLCSWRETLAASGADCGGWRLYRPPHHLDIYGAIYHEDIQEEFPEVFAAHLTAEGGEGARQHGRSASASSASLSHQHAAQAPGAAAAAAAAAAAGRGGHKEHHSRESVSLPGSVAH